MAQPLFDYESHLEACAQQDERAFQALYQQEAAQMLGLAITLLGRRDQAEDCVHDAFVQIWRNAQRFQRALGSGRAWIYSILRYRALNQLRSRGRTVELDDDFIERAADDSPQGIERNRRHPILLAFYRGLNKQLPGSGQAVQWPISCACWPPMAPTFASTAKRVK
ncbi:sigma factor [Pseudomonas leptonychotis]|uniref:sigma factor n=1 Tax=Pseudomonas leptonychotis TaxID=2448482 RepID=UPI00387023B9